MKVSSEMIHDAMVRLPQSSHNPSTISQEAVAACTGELVMIEPARRGEDSEFSFRIAATMSRPATNHLVARVHR